MAISVVQSYSTYIIFQHIRELTLVHIASLTWTGKLYLIESLGIIHSTFPNYRN